MKNRLELAVVILLAVAVTPACGGVEPTTRPTEEAPQETEAPPDTPEPTSTPTPVPTPTSVPTPTPAPAVSGTLMPWQDNTPIADRRLVLCEVVGDPEELLTQCVLTEETTTSDEQGEFQFHEIAPGTYFILYDSGVSDFDEGVEYWTGQTFDWDDDDWLNEIFRADEYEDGWVKINIPEGIAAGERITSYCALALLVGKSPFVLAHDVEKVKQGGVFERVIVDVVGGQTSQVELQVVYFGTQ